MIWAEAFQAGKQSSSVSFEVAADCSQMIFLVRCARIARASSVAIREWLCSGVYSAFKELVDMMAKQILADEKEQKAKIENAGKPPASCLSRVLPWQERLYVAVFVPNKTEDGLDTAGLQECRWKQTTRTATIGHYRGEPSGQESSSGGMHSAESRLGRGKVFPDIDVPQKEMYSRGIPIMRLASAAPGCARISCFQDISSMGTYERQAFLSEELNCLWGD